MLLLSAITQATWVAGWARYSRNAFAASRSVLGSATWLSMNPSIGASSAFSASYWVPKVGIREEVEVGEVGLRRPPGTAARRTCPRRYIPAFFWTSACAASCQVRPAAPSWWNGQELLPGVEHGLDLRVRPLLLAGHQVDVEVVAVQPQVEDVERAHRRPAVLVAEGERDEAVRLASSSARVLSSSNVVGIV